MLTDNQFLEKLGKKIEKLGCEKFKLQYHFSEACDIDTRTLRRIIRAKQNPTVLVLRKIAKGLDISLMELIDL